MGNSWHETILMTKKEARCRRAIVQTSSTTAMSRDVALSKTPIRAKMWVWSIKRVRASTSLQSRWEGQMQCRLQPQEKTISGRALILIPILKLRVTIAMKWSTCMVITPYRHGPLKDKSRAWARVAWMLVLKESFQRGTTAIIIAN